MRKIALMGMLAAAFVLPAAGVAKTPPVNKRAAALKVSKAERAKLGVTAFEVKYGSGKSHENALGNCVSQHLKK